MAHSWAARTGYCARREHRAGARGSCLDCRNKASSVSGQLRARWAALLAKYPACNFARPLQEPGGGAERVEEREPGQLSCEHLAEMTDSGQDAQSPGRPDPQCPIGAHCPAAGTKTQQRRTRGWGWGLWAFLLSTGFRFTVPDPKIPGKLQMTPAQAACELEVADGLRKARPLT